MAGAATRSPYSMVQELLNRSAQHRWGFVSNGLKLFMLRDNAALARAANVEFDLEAMMEGEVYADFMLLFLSCHQSRVEIPPDGKPEDCWLEKWANQADQQGTRAREKLRDGVEAAIKSLGAGFLTTKGNNTLRDRLRSGDLSTQDYYRQLLRLVYRLLMLLVAEEKKTESGDNLFHPPDTPPAVRDRYARFYSVGRIRTLAYERRGTSHTDLYESLKVLFEKLREGYAPLGIPGFGSFLFSATATADLDGVVLSNQNLLDALRHLCYTEDTSGRGGAVRRPVDFGNLGSEELGSVYESLLELHPLIDTDEGPFTLGTAAGHERKTTGSYYTPTSLINCLLDSAVDPVVAEAINVPDAAEAEKKLLDLKVCDPACGSGHFLIAAAERMATHLARLRTGDDQPGTIDVQHAKRDIIGRCIYGVDLNPMAVELCKVSLWMEALEPGKPLSFLDHHIQCGNSLLGTTPKLLAEGIPDDAFKPIEGDDKKVCTELKKDNKRERKDYEAGYRDFHFTYQLGNLPAEFARLTAESDESVNDVAGKQERYERLVKDAAYQNARLLADAWCAVFVWEKDNSDLGKQCPTERGFRNLQASPNSVLPHVRDEVVRLRKHFQFFHWHLAFPDVFRLPGKNEDAENAHCGWNGGFDVVLGNPPWIRQELMKPFKQLLVVFDSFKSTADSSVYFVELGLRTTRPSGRVAFLTPNKWFRAAYAAPFRKFLRQHSCVHLLVDFGHSRNLFPDADTFPAAVVLERPLSRVDDSTCASFVKAHDDDRNRVTLKTLVSEHGIDVPHGNLRPDRWMLESREASHLLDRLMSHGTPLEAVLDRPVISGLKSGFNDAFYIDTAIRNELVDSDPTCDHVLKRFLRGRDVKRWSSVWDGQWHIVIPSSQNRSWPWSSAANEKEAESIFSAIYPSIHRHLKQHETRLRKRQDKGRYWWELRACDYYDDLERPKLVVQCIAYYSQFAIDDASHIVNNKVIAIPTGDLSILSLLNSRVVWWIVNRTFQHMKDDGLSVDVQFLLKLPIPDLSADAKKNLESIAAELVSLQQRGDPDLNEVYSLEAQLDDVVSDAYGLTSKEVATLRESLPPRDPLVTLESKGIARAPQPIPAKPLREAALQREDVIRDVMLLLHEWNSAVSISALELGVLFLQDDKLRERMTSFARDGQPAAAGHHTTDTSEPAHVIVDFDVLYAEMIGGGMIEAVGQTGYRIKDASLVAQMSDSYFQRAREAIEVVGNFDQPEEIVRVLEREHAPIALQV